MVLTHNERMKRVHTLYIYVGIFSLFLLTACQDNLYFTLYQDLPQRQWDSNDSLYFNIPPAEQDLDVVVTFAVRTTSSFRYQDVVARAELMDGDSIISSIPLNISLYNHDEEVSYQGLLMSENYSKPQSLRMHAHHKYTLRIIHLMRLNPLDEVVSVGIIVER